ncbi:MAG: hypothetical protein AVDCRST_MAG05-3369, partial [uncultured Rubrobacteraceae bacterium]
AVDAGEVREPARPLSAGAVRPGSSGLLGVRERGELAGESAPGDRGPGPRRRGVGPVRLTEGRRPARHAAAPAAGGARLRVRRRGAARHGASRPDGGLRGGGGCQPPARDPLGV